MIGDNIKINRMHLQCQQYQDGQDTNHLPCQPLPGERHRLERPQCLEFVLSWMPLKVYLSPSLFIVLVFVIVSVCLSLSFFKPFMTMIHFQSVHKHFSFHLLIPFDLSSHSPGWQKLRGGAVGPRQKV